MLCLALAQLLTHVIVGVLEEASVKVSAARGFPRVATSEPKPRFFGYFFAFLYPSKTSALMAKHPASGSVMSNIYRDVVLELTDN